MKLPNCESAIVEIEKLRGYCLHLEHPRGRHKARVFQFVLGMNSARSEELRTALINAACTHDAKPGLSDEYGSRFIIDFDLRHGEQKARVRSCWILKHAESAARIVRCYVL